MIALLKFVLEVFQDQKRKRDEWTEGGSTDKRTDLGTTIFH